MGIRDRFGNTVQEIEADGLPIAARLPIFEEETPNEPVALTIAPVSYTHLIGFPDVIDRYRAAGENVGIYPINESSWMDMGQMEELEKMRRKLEQQS